VSNPSDVPESPFTPRYSRRRISKNYARAVNAVLVKIAVNKIDRFASTSDPELKLQLTLLNLLPHLFDELPEPTEPPDPDDPMEDPRLIELSKPRIPLIPICPCCLQGPGAHWVESCPELQPHHKLKTFQELQNQARVR
jgi:hypothetical protein